VEMKRTNNKGYWIKVAIGVLLVILALWAFDYWLSQPITDCDSCINGTTP